MDGGDVLGPLLSAWERFARERVDPLAFDRAGSVPPSVRDEIAALGLFGLTVPERYGGAGLGLRAVWPAVRALARADASLATSVGLHLGLGTRALVRYGTPAQHERWLPDLAAGRRVGAFAATEPEAGSDLRRMRTVARVDGDRLVVTGQKSYVTNGGFARLFTVYVATPGLGGQRTHGLVLVDPTDPGVVVGPDEGKLGLRASSTTPLFLDGASVPLDRLLGRPGEGAAQIAHALAWGRTLLSAGCVGAADVALALARRHCAGRRQFGEPLDRLPVVRERLADLEATRFAMEAIVERATDPGLDDDGLALASIAAKVACSEGAWTVVDTALQLHGGLGCIEESRLPLLLRDARAARIFEGANDVLLLRAGIEIALGAGDGRRLARRPREVHRLGALWLEREVGDAVDARARSLGTPEAAAAAAVWRAGSARRVAALDRPPVDDTVLDALLDRP